MASSCGSIRLFFWVSFLCETKLHRLIDGCRKRVRQSDPQVLYMLRQVVVFFCFGGVVRIPSEYSFFFGGVGGLKVSSLIISNIITCLLDMYRFKLRMYR